MSAQLRSTHPLILHPSQTSDFRNALQDFWIRAHAQFISNTLRLKYEWGGDSSLVLFPNSNLLSQRADLLWEHTCFEAFWSWDDQRRYWELNASPSGDWNLYRFDDYRSGQKREDQVVQIQLERHPQSLDVHIDLTRIVEGEVSVLNLGLTAVIELQGGLKTYCAIAHESDRPDFHVRKSFFIQI